MYPYAPAAASLLMQGGRKQNFPEINGDDKTVL